MTTPGSVEGHERIRLFLGLPLPQDSAERLAAWQEQELASVRDTRLVPRGNLHVTLAFLGWRPSSDVAGIDEVAREAALAAERPVLMPTGYRETRSVGMVVFADEDERAARLARAVGESLERLGVYRREKRRWLPHVTVLRFRRPPRARPALPDLGPVSPSEVALYHSVLLPTGAQYEILQSVPLGG
ncbi:MAG: RNA 2',3'-cyclic phosphodiesterase [Gaiellaceae bacterium]